MKKWHYFNSADEFCKTTLSISGKKHTICRSYCGRDMTKDFLHTELKSNVTCLICLSMINQIEYDRSGGR